MSSPRPTTSSKFGSRPIEDKYVYQNLLHETPVSRRAKRYRTQARIFNVTCLIILLAIFLIPLGYLLWRYFGWGLGVKINQSPINILAHKAIFDHHLTTSPLEVDYLIRDINQLWNSGHGWKITLKPDSNSTLRGPHLPGVYRLEQIHAHWDWGPHNGSEHLVNGRGYASEIHFVHYDTKYNSFNEAVNQKSGLAVLGVFLMEAMDDYIPTMQQLTSHFDQIEYKDEFVDLPEMNFRSLIPTDDHFWTYNGSLTTPPFSESVIWTVFRTPMPISTGQLQMFRYLKTWPMPTRKNESDFDHSDRHHHESNDDDFHGLVRYPQPINGRPIKASFDWAKLEKKR